MVKLFVRYKSAANGVSLYVLTDDDNREYCHLKATDTVSYTLTVATFTSKHAAVELGVCIDSSEAGTVHIDSVHLTPLTSHPARVSQLVLDK